LSILERNTGATRQTIAMREVFASSSDDGMPDLLLDRLWDGVPRGTLMRNVTRDGPWLATWGAITPQRRRGQIVHFFVDDYRFDGVWNHPAKARAALVAQQPAAVCEPEFSLYSELPLAVQMWQTYRTRWLGRYWQAAGLHVIPSLCWSTPASYSFAFAGVPVRAPLIAIEIRQTQSLSSYLHGLAAAHERLRPAAWLVYGADPAVVRAQWPQGVTYHVCPAWRPGCRRGWPAVSHATTIDSRHR
jgi:hypothetical protein